MKKLLVAMTVLALLLTLAACSDGPPKDTTVDTTPDAKFDLDIMGGNYKVIYDVTDPNAINIMTDMIGKIEAACGLKLASSNVSNPASEYEIQFGLKSGRSEGETVYNEIEDYADGVYGAYAIRSVDNKVVISASDKTALKVAADRFASMASTVFTVKADFDETAVFNIEDCQRGKLELVYADEFKSSAELAGIAVDGKLIGVVDGKNHYYRALDGNTELPTVEAVAKYSAAKVEITKLTYDYEIKVKSADGTKEEVYGVHFIDTAPLDSYSLDTWLIPYWEGYITYHESVMFVGDEGAPLLYAPEDVFSVRSYDLKTEYVEGVDYEVKDGKIYRLEGSAMPHFTWDEFYPTSKETSVSGNAFGGSKKPYVFFAEGTYFHKNQVFVTYNHQKDESLFVPEKSTKLHKFVEKLERGEEVNLVFFGDSITAGANASGRGENPQAPYTPMWTQMVTAALQAKYPNAKINYINTAVGGKETNWGIEELGTRVNAHNPDLVVLAFGMNDGGKTTESFTANIKKMVDSILSANPDCEIAVVGTMLPHSETTYFRNQNLQEAALKEMAKSYTNVDVVPMTSVHSSLLEHKRYFDMTGNNVNHPNDFLIRIYAQTILEVLIGE